MILGSEFDGWVCWLFFAITVDYNTHILNAFLITNLSLLSGSCIGL
jgi:hypothetical protein